MALSFETASNCQWLFFLFLFQSSSWQKHPDVVGAAASATSHPTNRRRLIKHFSCWTEQLQLCNSITWQGRVEREQSPSRPLRWGRMERIACPLLPFCSVLCDTTGQMQADNPFTSSTSLWRDEERLCARRELLLCRWGEREAFKGRLSSGQNLSGPLWGSEVLTEPHQRRVFQTGGTYRSTDHPCR